MNVTCWFSSEEFEEEAVSLPLTFNEVTSLLKYVEEMINQFKSILIILDNMWNALNYI